MAPGGGGERPADPLETGAEALAAVAGDEKDAPARIEEAEAGIELPAQRSICLYACDHPEQRVDDRIAGHLHRFRRHTFGEEVGARLLGRGKVPRGQRARELAVGLLGPGGVEVAGPEPCLHVRHGDLPVVAREASRERGSGVAVHQHQVGSEGFEHPAHAAQHRAGDVGQVLPRGHDVEVEVRAEAEEVEHLVEHLAVLGGDAEPRLEARVGCERPRQRRHLDRLRPRSKGA